MDGKNSKDKCCPPKGGSLRVVRAATWNTLDTQPTIASARLLFFYRHLVWRKSQVPHGLTLEPFLKIMRIGKLEGHREYKGQFLA